MEKFYGKVGYCVTTEDPVGSGIVKDVVTERKYYGDVLRNSTRWQSSDSINDNLTVSNRISILADAYAYQNFSLIKYVEWMGVLWKVDSIEVERPRLILSLGGEYNG